MNKYSIMLLTAVAAVACSQEGIEEVKHTPVEPVVSNLELRASFEGEQTRISTDDGLSFKLDENTEQIGVYVETAGVSTIENLKFTAGAADDNGWLSFTPSQNVHVQPTSMIYAYAPYVATNVDFNGSVEDVTRAAWDGTRVVNLPAEQTQAATHEVAHLAEYYTIVATPATPAARETLDDYSVDLQFSGVFALVKFVLLSEETEPVTVSKVVFSSDDAALAGNFALNLKHDNPSLANADYAPQPVEGKTESGVSVSLTTPVTLQNGEQAEVYAVVNAGEFATATIEVYAELNGKEVVYTKQLTSKTITRQQRAAFGVKMIDGKVNDYAQEVVDVLQQGGDLTIEQSVDLSEKAVAAPNGALMIEIPAGTKLNINVPEGVTLTLANEGENIRLFNYGDVTISGKGTIEGAYGIVRNYGTMTVESGNFKTTNATGGTALCNERGGTMVINDATVDAAFYALYNDNGTMTVNGGSFTSSSNNKTGSWAYCVSVVGKQSVTTINNATVTGVQGGISAADGATLTIEDGIFSTYFNEDNEERNFYALYSATDATAIVHGGYFYREGSASRPCILIGNNDTGTTYGHMELTAGYYRDCGKVQNATGVIAPAAGYKWEELTEPMTLTNPVNGKTNTYYYQIVEGYADPAYDEATKTYTITNARELAWVAGQTNGGNNFEGLTVKLADNIDLENNEWTPIGTRENGFAGTFDGGGKTISNLKVISTASPALTGLFGWVSGSVKNFTIERATISSTNTTGGYGTAVAVALGYPSAKIENITVSDATVNSYRQTGGIVGYLYGTVSGCSVSNAVITVTPNLENGAYDNGDKVGGIVGFMGGDSGNCFDNTVTDVHITAYRDAGGITGILYGGSIPTFKNNKVTDSSVTLDNSKKCADDSDNAGAIAGRYSGTSADMVDSSNVATNVTVVKPTTNMTTSEQAAAAINAGSDIATPFNN